jgi:hypothetical protein
MIHSVLNLLNIKKLCCWRRGLLRILLVESFNTTGGVKQFMLSGIVRMTRRADFDVDITHRRAGFEFVAANADNFRFSVFWVNFGFHYGTFYLLL